MWPIIHQRSAVGCQEFSRRREIDASELFRVFPKGSSGTEQSNDTQPRVEQDATLLLRLEMAEKERDLERAERERELMQDAIKDLRQRLDRAEGRIAGLLPSPSKPSSSLWRRLFR
jgi:hypothetical protein